MDTIRRDLQFWKFSAYGFLKNLNFSDPFILLFFLSEGLSFASVGLLISIKAVMVNLLEIPSGIFADGFGRRKAMIVCFTAYICSFVLFFFSSGFLLFAAAMTLFAVGEAFRTGTHKSMILDYLKRTDQLNRRLAYYGRTRAASQFGSAVSAAVAAGMVFYSGNYRYLFLVSIGPYIAGVLLIASYPRMLDFPMEPENGLQPSGGYRQRFRDSFAGLAAMFRQPVSRCAVLNNGIFNGLFKATKDYIQPILVDAALLLTIFSILEPDQRSSVLIGGVYIGIYLISSAASGVTDRAVTRLGGQPAAMDRLFAAGGFLIAFTGAVLFAGVPAAAAVALVIFYAVYNIRRPMELSYLSALIPERAMAAGLSGESQLQSLAAAVLAPLLGLGADLFGLPAALSAAGLGALVIGKLFSVRKFSRNGTCRSA